MISLRFLTAAGFALALASTAQAQAPDMGRLHGDLRLTSAQETAWQTFQAASNDADAEARRRNAALMMPNLSAPRRVDLSIALMQADLDTLQRRGAALKAFYAGLTPSQQVVFDRDTAPRAHEDGDDDEP